MAKIKGLDSGITGKMGSVVVYQMYGKTVVRSLPKNRKKTVSEKLKKEQNLFATVMKTMQRFKPVISLGFASTARQRSAFHQALSVNLQAYRAAENRTGYRWAKLSEGTRKNLSQLQLKAENDKLVLHWVCSGEKDYKLHNDRVIVLVVGGKTGRVAMSIGKACRKDERCILNFSPGDDEGACEVGVFAVAEPFYPNKGPKQVSPTCWLSC